MKTQFLKFLFFASVSGSLLSGCSKDDDQAPVPATPAIFFFDTIKALPAAGDSVQIAIGMEQAATEDGFVQVRFSGDAVYGEDYITNPAAANGLLRMDFQAVMQSTIFTVYRLENTSRQGAVSLRMKLQNPSQEFKVGEADTTVVNFPVIVQPEEAEIDFADVFIHLLESDENAFEVKLNLSNALQQESSVVLEIDAPEGKLYGTHYVTAPAANANKIELAIAPGSQTTSFSVVAVNDDLATGTYEFRVKMVAASGQLTTGAIDEVIIRIEEDDAEPVAEVHSIADLRDYFPTMGGSFWLSTDYLIEGVITSASNVADDKTAYIQDATGGIMLRFTVKNFLNIGDKVRINLKGATGDNIDGQKGISGVHDMLGTKLAVNQVVIPEVITFEQLQTGQYEGKRVTVVGAKFRDADGTRIFEGEQALVSATSGAYVKTYSSASFRNNTLPQTVIAVTGIVGGYKRLLPQVYNWDIQL